MPAAAMRFSRAACVSARRRQRDVMKRRRRHLGPEFLLVLGVLELEEGEGAAVGHGVEGVAIGAHLAEQLVRLAPSRDQGHADDVLVELARLLLIARDVGIVMQPERKLL